jgi:tetratricopeptide (TPR) repeat protein
MNLGNVYTSLIPLSVANSYDSAVSAYDKAKALAPNNPSILLARATLEMTNKNNDGARPFIDQALLLKADYTDAIFLLAQIETNEGNLSAAIKQAERAGTLTPGDPTVFFRLGLLRYNNSEFTSAVSAFEQAVILDTNYLNARFFLGKSYQKVGRTDEALTQFNLLGKVLPDNQDVKDAISSLSSGATTSTPQPAKTPTKTTVPAKLPLSGQH